MINKDEDDKHLVKSFKTFCIIGDPINHTLSPLIHNTAFSYLNLNYSYIAFKVSQIDLEDSIHSLKRINAAGFNVTLPHKESIIKYIDGLSEEAKTTGAVNTVNNEDGKFIGYNTDIHGIITPIEERGINLENAQILILGAGGSCRVHLVDFIQKKKEFKI